jgi:hypothetical protein
MNDAQQSSYDSHCPECGAIAGQGVERCWLCGWQRESESSSAPADSVPPPVPPRPVDQGFSYSLETLMLVTTLVAVAMGAIVLFPGVGIILAIMLLPAFIRTSMVVRRHEEKGKAVALWQRVSLYLGSFATSIVILTVVAVASVGTFCAFCLSLHASPGGFRALSWPVAILAAIAATITTVHYIVKWIRRRWKRDTKID